MGVHMGIEKGLSLALHLKGGPQSGVSLKWGGHMVAKRANCCSTSDSTRPEQAGGLLRLMQEQLREGPKAVRQLTAARWINSGRHAVAMDRRLVR